MPSTPCHRLVQLQRRLFCTAPPPRAAAAAIPRRCPGVAPPIFSIAGATRPLSSTAGTEEISFRATAPEHDIAIIGGGMVGMALASALASMPLTRHLSVAIVDANPSLTRMEPFKKNEVPDSRVSTVTPATITFFQDIGAWKYVRQHRHAYFDKMQNGRLVITTWSWDGGDILDLGNLKWVWDYTGLGYTRYNAKDVGKDNLGCVVENKVLHYALLSYLQSNTDFKKTLYSANLDAMTCQSQSSYTKMKDGFPIHKSASSAPADEQLSRTLTKLDLSDGNHIYAKLVVGADGGKSRVRDIAGLKTTGWIYSQNAIVCTVDHDGENHCAWQRFLPSGPIALLPMGDNYSNIVWSMSPEESVERKRMGPDDFVKTLNHALDYGYGPHPQSSFFDKYLQNFSLNTRQEPVSVKENFQAPPRITRVLSERLAFPLALMHAHNYVSKGVALIGDAAHTIHPLAGQGVNLGFGDASVLAKVISEGISSGTGIGELSLLKKYERERKAANVAMMAIMDGFQKAFSIDFAPLNVLRAAAFHGAQYIAPLKKNIISFATGEHKWPYLV